MSQRPGDAPTESRRVSVALAGRKFFLLFLFLLASLVLFPYAENSVLGYYGFRVLRSTAIVLCVYVVSFRRSLVVDALLLAVPTFLHRVLNLGAPSSWFSILNIVLSFLFDAFIVVVIFRRVFASKQPNSETIFGELCIYLLAGFAFASIYGMVALLQPRAFYLDPLANVHTVPDRLDFIYYSFGTITWGFGYCAGLGGGTFDLGDRSHRRGALPCGSDFEIGRGVSASHGVGGFGGRVGTPVAPSR
jgi:hypothetical protein